MAIDKNKIKYDYFTFDGVISKAEFLRSFLVLLVIAVVINLLAYNVFYTVGILRLLLQLVSIVLIIAMFSITMRRLRDLGQSPLWSLLLLFPPTAILLIIYLIIAERKTIL